jgi:hypothetical protein
MNTRVPAHDRFEDRLLRAILDDFDHLSAAARPLPGQSRNVRTGAAVALPAAAAVAALAAVSAPLLHHPSGQAPAAGRAHTAAGSVPIAAHDAAYVVARTETALSGTGRYVLVTTSYAPDSQTGAPTVSRSWVVTGGNTVRNEVLGATGSPVEGSVITTTPKATTVVSIDYQARTWSTSTQPAQASSGPGPLPQTPAQAAQMLRSQLGAGTATLIGPATIGGRSTVEIEVRSAQGTQRIWVDPSSYLPVQEIDTAAGVAQDSPQADRSDYRWLQPTAANMALVTAAAAIPSSFSEVPPAPAG